MSEAPKPGIYVDIPMTQYHGWDAVNVSTLNNLHRSPAHCLYYQEHPKSETTSTKFGTAAHCAILEAESFEKRYVTEPDISKIKDAKGKAPASPRNAKEYKDAVKALTKTGLIVLTQEDWDGCMWLRDNAQRHKKTKALLDAMTHHEVSVVAVDKETGLTCKVRPDLLCESVGIVGDFKTTRNAEKAAFARDIYNFDYHRSAPFYVDVMNALRPEHYKHHVFLVGENTPPYEVATYVLGPTSMGLGRREYRELLDRYAWCKKANDWPGYGTEMEAIEVPNWAFYNEEDSI